MNEETHQAPNAGDRLVTRPAKDATDDASVYALFQGAPELAATLVNENAQRRLAAGLDADPTFFAIHQDVDANTVLTIDQAAAHLSGINYAHPAASVAWARGYGANASPKAAALLSGFVMLGDLMAVNKGDDRLDRRIDFGAARAFALARGLGTSQSAAAPAAPMPPRSQQIISQDGDTVLRALIELGHAPDALPKPPRGSRGISSQLRAHLQWERNKVSRALKDLEERRKIAYSEQESPEPEGRVHRIR